MFQCDLSVISTWLLINSVEAVNDLTLPIAEPVCRI